MNPADPDDPCCVGPPGPLRWPLPAVRVHFAVGLRVAIPSPSWSFGGSCLVGRRPYSKKAASLPPPCSPRTPLLEVLAATTLSDIPSPGWASRRLLSAGPLLPFAVGTLPPPCRPPSAGLRHLAAGASSAAPFFAWTAAGQDLFCLYTPRWSACPPPSRLERVALRHAAASRSATLHQRGRLAAATLSAAADIARGRRCRHPVRCPLPCVGVRPPPRGWLIHQLRGSFASGATGRLLPRLGGAPPAPGLPLSAACWWRPEATPSASTYLSLPAGVPCPLGLFLSFVGFSSSPVSPLLLSYWLRAVATLSPRPLGLNGPPGAIIWRWHSGCLNVEVSGRGGGRRRG